MLTPLYFPSDCIWMPVAPAACSSLLCGVSPPWGSALKSDCREVCSSGRCCLKSNLSCLEASTPCPATRTLPCSKASTGLQWGHGPIQDAASERADYTLHCRMGRKDTLHAEADQRVHFSVMRVTSTCGMRTCPRRASRRITAEARNACSLNGVPQSLHCIVYCFGADCCGQARHTAWPDGCDRVGKAVGLLGVALTIAHMPCRSQVFLQTRRGQSTAHNRRDGSGCLVFRVCDKTLFPPCFNMTL